MMRLNRGLNRALRGKEVVTKCIPFIYAELAGKCRMMWVEITNCNRGTFGFCEGRELIWRETRP
jgi:hypothetical protein